ncbi:MAG TPA: hypothetical protein VKH20_07355 [Solirubrobacterales bacterium]|nr:hypothetical protein [Solirubrobacterales bacterium]
MNRLRATFQGRKGAVLSVSLIVWVLAAFDLTLLPRVSSLYLGTLPAKRIAGVTVTPGSVLLTSTDPTGPANLWVLSRSDAAARVVGVQLPPWHHGLGARTRPPTIGMRTTLPPVVGRPVDVETWAGAGPALFVVSSPRRSPTLRLISLRTGRPLLESTVPLPVQKSDLRDFFVARWSGPRPDLFVLDRNVNRRKPLSPRPWLIRIYSGESGFKKLILESSIKKSISKQLSQRNWWLDFGVRRPPKPSLVLVTRGKKTGTGQTEVHALSGHSRFHRFSLHTGTELPERDSLTQRFLFQSERKGGTVLMAQIRYGRLGLVPVPLP